MELEYGQTYYQVTYADRDFIMPGLTPMVYVGENILDGDVSGIHYFQDTVSVMKYGLVGDVEDTSECCVSSFQLEELGHSIVSIDDAVKIVASAAEKAKRLGYPKLNNVSGT